MEKFFMNGPGPLFVIVGIVITVTVGIMSLLLPILVFRVLSEISKINEKMSKILTSLNEVAQATRESSSQRQAEDARLGTFESRKNGPLDIGEKSLRFK